MSLAASPRLAPRQLLVWPASPDMQDIAQQLGYFGYQVHQFDAMENLLAALAEGNNHHILMDLSAMEGLAKDRQARLREALKGNFSICLSDHGELARRLAAVRMGCQGFLLRPASMPELLDTLERISPIQSSEPGKVLIIDDSSAMTDLYAAILNHAGFMAYGINDPRLACGALAESQPELILLDMYMPEISGEELAKVIRQQDAFVSIPIVYLSGETDLKRQLAAMALGADEFLQKPIRPDHLVSAVRSRISRYRALRALMLRDGLTGLLNHSSFKERLRAEVAGAQRHGRSLSLAMIDLDHFKGVNDSHGHQAGDRVLKSVAVMLRQRLRRSDLVGRYGGEEFAVVMPDTPLATAREVMDELRADFARIVHRAGGVDFNCSLSAGLAQWQAEQDTESFILAADQALYRAKREGRNRVVLQAAAERCL